MQWGAGREGEEGRGGEGENGNEKGGGGVRCVYYSSLPSQRVSATRCS